MGENDGRLFPPLSPMTARTVERTPRAAGLAYEAKWDGYRVLLFARAHAPHLQSRRGADLGPGFPDILRAAAELGEEAVFDGELVVIEDGAVDFAALQARAQRTGPRAAAAAAAHPAHFIAFDLLQLGDEVTMARPYRERRALLEEVFTRRDLQPPWALCPMTTDPDRAGEWLDPAWAAVGVEGMVVKGLGQPYRPGERGWRKLRARATAEAVVGAVTGPVTSPDVLLLGRYDARGELRMVAQSAPVTRTLRRRLGPLLTPAGPGHPWAEARFHSGWGTRDILDHRCVSPEHVVEFEADVAFDQGRWRHPVQARRIRPELHPEEIPHFPAGAA
ncbi:ATP-dependent DNA ligase [Streptomyces sp. A73]|uniref:ATP-dependent DNA ligase n=1 Tax=Streptomyces TaxID=1883 RepID=UPI000C1A5F36|nr:MULTISPECIES: ATP-dependent DNA ligase [unclassified Streptomyces]MBQ0866329.1 ATP-dependent DNA ligase [Streptomyces sp. RK75]MBQ1124262.1 ATP-dependent DNA ligase [Streptomyces sp. B15]MBQ1161836.1 ATP-dependent DNA ligase [Streptomyces sp. A73]